MGLTNAWNVATSSLATNAGLTALVSRNISNAQNSTGYVSAKVANLVTNSSGASVIQSITDLTNATLFNSMLSSNSASASAQALSNGVTQLQQTVGDATTTADSTTAATSPSTLLQSLSTALQTYSSSPSNSSARSRRGHGGAKPRQRLEFGERHRAKRARDGRPGHGHLRRHHQFAAVAVPAAQYHHRQRHGDRRRHFRRPRPAQHPPAKPFAADRHHHHDQFQRLDVDLYRQRRHAVRHHGAQRHHDADDDLYGVHHRRGGLCRRRSGDGRQRHHADPVRGARRLRQPARQCRHPVPEPARLHRRRPGQRLRRNQRHDRRQASGPVHLFRRDLDSGLDAGSRSLPAKSRFLPPPQPIPA